MNKVNTKTIIFALATILLCSLTSSQAALLNTKSIYKIVHKDGSVTYSDQPSEGAIEIHITVPTSIIQSNIQQAPTAPPKMVVKTKINHQVFILHPLPEATIRNNEGEISIAASVQPKANGFFQLIINKEVHESATGMFKLENMDRGEYEYSIKFIDNSGKIIASSDIRKLYLHQASALIN